MRKKGRALQVVSSLAFALVMAPSAEAQLAGTIRNAFQQFFSWMQVEAIMFGLTFIFLLVLFYAIFAAGMTRVTVFHDGGKINRYGKMVALSFAVLADIGLLFVLGSSPGESMRNVLNAMGTFAAIAFSLLVFGISYMNFKDGKKTWPLVLLTTGLGMVVYGLLTGGESWFSFGWLFIIIGIIWFLLSGNKSEGKGDVPIPKEEIGGWAPKVRRTMEEVSEPSSAEKELERDKTGVIRGRVIDGTATLSLPNSVLPTTLARTLVNPATKGIIPFLGDGRVYVKRHADEQVIATGTIDPNNGLFVIENVPMVKDAIVFVRKEGKVAGTHMDEPFGRPGEKHEKVRCVDLIKNNPETNVIVCANPPMKEFYSLHDDSRLRDPPPPREIEPTGRAPGTVVFDDMEEPSEEEMRKIREKTATIKEYSIIHPNIPRDGRIFMSPRLQDWFPDIEDQGHLKACTCYAGGSLYEFLLGFEHNQQLSSHHISKAYLFYMLHGGTKNEGSDSTLTPLLLFQEGGCCNLQYYTPDQYLNGVTPDEKAAADAARRRIKDIRRVSKEPEDWVRVLCDLQPIYLAIGVDDAFTGFNGLVFPGRGKVLIRKGWHAIVVVSYKSEVSDGISPPGPAFLIRNSWGKDWGANGYAWVHQDYLKANLWDAEPPFIVLGKDESKMTIAKTTPEHIERAIISLIQELRLNKLPEKQSLGWHDDKKQECIKNVLSILDRLDRHAAILGPKKVDLDRMTTTLRKFLLDVQESYTHGSNMNKLKEVKDEDINRYLEDITNLFLNSPQIAAFRVNWKIS